MAIAGAITLGLAVTSTIGGDEALAVDECGAPEPGGRLYARLPTTTPPRTATSSTTTDAWHGNFTLRLPYDLVVDYDRDNPGDDVYFWELYTVVMSDVSVFKQMGQMSGLAKGVFCSSFSYYAARR